MTEFNLKPLIGAMFFTFAIPSYAMHIGEPLSTSKIGESLRVELPVLDTVIQESKDLSVKSVAYPYARKFDGHPEFNTTITYLNDQPIIVIESKSIITDSVIDLAIEMKWSGGRMIQPVTLVLDTSDNNNEKLPVYTNIQVPVVENKERVEIATSKIVPERSKSFQYHVKKGDTLYGIARKIAIPNQNIESLVNVIYKANPNAFLGSKNKLLAGSFLNLESNSTSFPETTTIKTTHSIKTHKHSHSAQYILPKIKSNSDNLVQKAEQKVKELELKVESLIKQSKEIDLKLEQLTTKKASTINKKTSMPLLNEHRKGLLSVLNAYRDIRTA